MDTAREKRRPPTFNHLPLNRAKKLKQSWVQVQKVRSQWKAQKRKEGLVSSRPTLPDGKKQKRSVAEEYDQDEERNASSEREKSDSGDEKMETSTGRGEPRRPLPNARREEAAQPLSSQTTSSRGKTTPRRGEPVSRGHGRGRGGGNHHRPLPEASKDVDAEEEKPSLRELQNKAYSRASLHTLKSSRPKNGSHGHTPRGTERGGITQRGGGRGQPDMRLRMNAMLKKIKRDIV